MFTVKVQLAVVSAKADVAVDAAVITAVPAPMMVTSPVTGSTLATASLLLE